jgi:chaperonin GroES
MGQIYPLDVKEGDQILFGKWTGSEVKIGDEELLIMKESEILGVIAPSSLSRSEPSNKKLKGGRAA